MTIDFLSLRRKMVDNQIRTVDVTDLGILAAFLRIKREEFVPDSRRNFAYLDSDVVFNSTQENEAPRSLMRPAALARLLQLAQLKPQDRVLNIGATTGYACALLSGLVAHVVALESDADLSHQALEILRRQSIDNVEVVCAPMEEGHVASAPYDVILCEGAADFVPPVLFEQLRENGRLLIVEGHGLAGEAKLYLKENGVVSVRGAFNLALAPLRGFQNGHKFVF